uniref:ZP domain-containing protein n=1 Tax=Elaeophora elaphi TaxID=1147741 RepID=A0A0R3S687_9BILA
MNTQPYQMRTRKLQQLDYADRLDIGTVLFSSITCEVRCFNGAEMIIIKPSVFFLTIVAAVRTTQNPLISAPFDNFRIECTKSSVYLSTHKYNYFYCNKIKSKSGAVRISARMVGSQGFIRQDIVFAIVCERVDELYPWHGIPAGIVELEREDCYYSHLFDPVVDTESLYTCRSREYISGVTRLSDTRVQVLCCRLRTRDEANCREKEFTKPIGSDPRTEIYHRMQLINSIAVEGNNYRVRFCDLAPRAIGLFLFYLKKKFCKFDNFKLLYRRNYPCLSQIYDDLPVTAPITTETPINGEHHASETERRLTSQATTAPSAIKHVIQIFRPSTLYNSEENQNTRNMSILSSAKNDHSQDIESSLEFQRTSGGKFSTVVDRVKEGGRSTDWMTDEINKQNSAISLVSFIPTSVTQSHSASPKTEVTTSDRNRTTATPSYIATSSLQTTTSASLILLKPLNSKAQHTEATSRNRQLTTKTSTKRRMKQTLSWTISTTSLTATPQLTTTSVRSKELKPTTESPFLSSSQLRRNSSNGAYIDEETKYSPFEKKENNPSRDNQAFGSDNSFSLTSADPLETTSMENDGFSYKISNKIRRAPIKSQDVGVDYTEYDLPIKKSADGSRTYVPENHEPLNAPSAAIVYNAGKQNNVSGSAKRRKKKVQQHVQESYLGLKDDVSKELLSMNDDEINSVSTVVHTSSSTVSSEQDDLKFPTTDFSQINIEKTPENVYNPAKFYRTPPPKRPTQTEKVLTFCTKEIAIRDRHNLVIACGSETEIWQPFRCPEGSECFFSADSSYRICCAVAEAVRYAQ